MRRPGRVREQSVDGYTGLASCSEHRVSMWASQDRALWTDVDLAVAGGGCSSCAHWWNMLFHLCAFL